MCFSRRWRAYQFEGVIGIKKAIALCLFFCVMMGLVACGGGDDSAQVGSGGAASGPANVDASEPEAPALFQQYLTGAEVTESYVENRRITAVMLNNVPQSRPQNGIGDASILVEIKVEYGVTRFMAIFDDFEKMPDKVGGLRSARDQFFQMIIPSWAFYVHDGPSHPSHPVNQLMDRYNYRDYDIPGGYVLTKDPSRGTEQYSWEDVSGAAITEYIRNNGMDDYRYYSSPFFNFVPYTEEPRVPTGGVADTIGVAHNISFRTFFEYDAGSGRYMMSMYDSRTRAVEPTVDNNNNQRLGFENVLVLFAPCSTWPNTAPENLPKFDYGNTSFGVYFSQGHYELVYWSKGAADEPLQILNWDKSESKVPINVGKTYISVVDVSEWDGFYESVISGSGAAYAADGGNNPFGDDVVVE